MNRLEKITHLVLILVAVGAFAIVVDRTYFHVQDPNSAEHLVGTRIVLPRVQWSANRYNVVLAISANCRFCRESAPFYQSLGQLADRANVIVVSNDDPATIQGFLRSRGINVEQIVSASFADIGVRGTPTVLVVDQHGEVRQALSGKQPAGTEDRFLSQLRERSL